MSARECPGCRLPTDDDVTMSRISARLPPWPTNHWACETCGQPVSGAMQREWRRMKWEEITANADTAPERAP